MEEFTESKPLFALVEFDRPVLAAPLAWAIGARLDLDKQTSSCRMAFYGRLRHSFTSKTFKQDGLPQLKVISEAWIVTLLIYTSLLGLDPKSCFILPNIVMGLTHGTAIL